MQAYDTPEFQADEPNSDAESIGSDATLTSQLQEIKAQHIPVMIKIMILHFVRFGLMMF